MKKYWWVLVAAGVIGLVLYSRSRAKSPSVAIGQPPHAPDPHGVTPPKQDTSHAALGAGQGDVFPVDQWTGGFGTDEEAEIAPVNVGLTY